MGRSLLTLLACAACGGSGSATVSGSVGGLGLSHVAEVTAIDVPPPSCARPQPSLSITISDRAGACSALQHSDILANATLLSLLISPGDDPNPILPGHYVVGQDGHDPVGYPTNVQAAFGHTGADCSAAGQNATAGTIDVSSIDGGNVAGSFNLTFPGGALTGSFRTAGCTLPASVACATDTFVGCAP